jgi:Ca2+/Na+ antiporter
MIYSCLSITILCDTYFVPSLEFIGECNLKIQFKKLVALKEKNLLFYISALSLTTDITGALFTPIGTAGPEVFSSLVGVFVTDSNIGTGNYLFSLFFKVLLYFC